MAFTVGNGGGGDDGGGSGDAAVPSLISPSGTISDSTPTYTWNSVSVSGLWRYQVQVSSTGGGVVHDDGFDPNDCNGSTCSVTPGSSLAAGDYTWHVRARGDSGWGAWSADQSFTVASTRLR